MNDGGKPKLLWELSLSEECLYSKPIPFSSITPFTMSVLINDADKRPIRIQILETYGNILVSYVTSLCVEMN